MNAPPPSQQWGGYHYPPPPGTSSGSWGPPPPVPAPPSRFAPPPPGAGMPPGMPVCTSHSGKTFQTSCLILNQHFFFQPSWPPPQGWQPPSSSGSQSSFLNALKNGKLELISRKKNSAY